MPDQRAACIVVNDANEVLVLHSTTAGQWQLPGALVQANEDAGAAAIRGLREKMGVTLTPERTLGSRPGAEPNIVMDTWLLCRLGNKDIALNDHDTFDKWGFFSLVSLTQRYDELSPTTRNFLEAMAYGEIDLDV